MAADPRPRTIDAAGIGLAVRDLTVRLDAHPEPDTKVRAAAFAESGGGPVPTALVTMARLGGSTAFLGVAGDDAAGRFLKGDLGAEGVDVSGFLLRPGLATPASVILVEKDGRRVVCEWRQADLPWTVADLEAASGTVERARILLVDARLPGAQAEAARRARRAGVLVMLDCGHPRPGVEELLALCDVAILSRSYPRALHGERHDPRAFVHDLAGRLPAGGRRIAGLTLGPEGCLLAEGGGEPILVPGFRVEAIDTTGAGDVFHGAFAHALLRGAGAADAGRFANAAAALKCRGLTGRARLPGEAEIVRVAGGDPIIPAPNGGN